MQRLSSKYPAAVWHEYEPVPTNIPSAVYHFDKAEIIFSIGADFLSSGPASLIQQRDFAAATASYRSAAGDEPVVRCRKHAESHRRDG